MRQDLLAKAGMSNGARARRLGYGFALLSCFAWGFIPLYWNLLAAFSPVDVLVQRVVWSAIFAAPFVLRAGSRSELIAALVSPTRRSRLVASGLLIGANWTLFVYAIQTRRLSEASLGYFLSPLLAVLIGVLFLRERLRPLQWLSVACAAFGVLVLVLGSGSLPWIAVLLPVSFAAYAWLRKVIDVPATVGLFIETLILLPFALGYLALQAWQGSGPFQLALGQWALASLAGPLTALPLIWFARAARLLPLSVLGPIQYVSPTLQFLTAVVFFGESMPRARWIAFGFIWTALIVFSLDSVRASNLPKRDVKSG